MPSESLPIEQVLILLAATPARIAAVTAGLEPAQLRTASSPDEWPANEVLAHLRACADMSHCTPLRRSGPSYWPSWNR